MNHLPFQHGFLGGIKRTRPDDDLDSDFENELFVRNDSWPRFVVLSSASDERL